MTYTCPICKEECPLRALTDQGYVVQCPEHGKQTVLKEDTKDEVQGH